MEKPTEHNKGFKQLLNGLLDGQLTAEQVCQLERQIQTSPEAMKLYVDTVTLTVGLRKYSQTQRGAMKEAIHQQTPDESVLWETLANDEKQAPTIKMVKKRNWLWWKSKPVLIQPKEQNIERVRRKISRLPVATLIVASAALVFLLLYIRLLPLMNIAQLKDSIHAVWDNRHNQFREGIELFPAVAQQTLREGFAHVHFASGAEVLFEAPCQFVLESKNQLFLKQGKVFIKVPKKAIGFAVRTPNSRIVDLGTEFGVFVGPDGTSQFQMFSGKASVTAGLAGKEKNSELLTAGQTFNVEADNGEISRGSFQRDNFVQLINSSNNIVWRGEKSLSLADFVVGGNGLQAEPEGSLNPVSGMIEPEAGYLAEDQMRNPPQTYNTIAVSPFIDGVFVPNGANGPVEISSMNHSFAFPKTIATIWYPLAAVTYYVTDKNEGSQSPDQGGVPRPAFYLHANLGVTFDLEAIRNAYPDTKITGFRTQYAIRWDGTPHGNKVDFWMLVDGQNRHEHRAKTAGKKMEDAYIPLSDTDRFLTLAVTEANDGLGYDWGVFVNPVIELETHQDAD
jgi:hypothetical protein